MNGTGIYCRDQAIDWFRAWHLLIVAKSKSDQRPLMALDSWTTRKMLFFFVALCLCYFHPQIGIPDAKVTIITHLSFSQQFWRMQQIPKPEIRYTECFIWFYKHIHSLVFSIWIRDLKHSFKQKNWNSFFIYNLLWHEDQIAGTVEHFLSIN